MLNYIGRQTALSQTWLLRCQSPHLACWPLLQMNFCKLREPRMWLIKISGKSNNQYNTSCDQWSEKPLQPKLYPISSSQERTISEVLIYIVRAPPTSTYIPWNAQGMPMTNCNLWAFRSPLWDRKAREQKFRKVTNFSDFCEHLIDQMQIQLGFTLRTGLHLYLKKQTKNWG